MSNQLLYLTHALLLLIILAAAGCSRESDEEKTPTAGGTSYTGRIVAVGDSLTAGLGLLEEQGYPAQLQAKLKSEGYNFEVINAGVSGETTSGTSSRLNWILTLEPDIVILESGANDGLRGIPVDIPRKNLQQILQTLRDKKIITVFAGMRMVWNLGPEYTLAFNKIYPSLAKEYGVIFMPFFLQDVAMVPALNRRDGIHPNSEGYAVIVENLYPYVIQAIDRLENSK